jgi:hypothetical protein
LFRPLLLQIGGANIADPPPSSSLAKERRLLSLLLSTAGARFPTLAAISELLAHRALGSAAVVVARRGKNASALFSSVRRRAIPDARSCISKLLAVSVAS